MKRIVRTPLIILLLVTMACTALLYDFANGKPQWSEGFLEEIQTNGLVFKTSPPTLINEENLGGDDRPSSIWKLNGEFEFSTGGFIVPEEIPKEDFMRILKVFSKHPKLTSSAIRKATYFRLNKGRWLSVYIAELEGEFPLLIIEPYM